MNASNAFKNNWSQDLILKHTHLILELDGGWGGEDGKCGLFTEFLPGLLTKTEGQV